MKAHHVLLAFLMLLPAAARAGEEAEAEAETITIAGREYRVIPDEVFRKMGFEFPDVPREENAAYDYIAAINAFEAIEDRQLRRLVDDLSCGDASWAAAPPEVRAHVERNQETLRLLRAAAEKEQCHFPFSASLQLDPEVPAIFSGWFYGHLGGTRQMARFLALVGSMHEHDGDHSAALGRYTDTAALGVHVAQDRAFIPALTGKACVGIGLACVRRCVTRRNVDGALLLETQKRLAQLRALRPALLDVIRSERVYSKEVLEYAFREELALDTWLDVEFWPHGVEWLLLKSRGTQETARAGNEEFWNTLERLAQVPLPEYLQKMREFSESDHEKFRRAVVDLPGFITLWALTAREPILRYRTIHERGNLSWTVADVFLALARYKAKHGEYPERLEEARELMLSDGADPFSGELLKYRREADGSFTLWSVGENLTDDGGKREEGKSRWQSADYVWHSAVIAAER